MVSIFLIVLKAKLVIYCVFTGFDYFAT